MKETKQAWGQPEARDVVREMMAAFEAFKGISAPIFSASAGHSCIGQRWATRSGPPVVVA